MDFLIALGIGIVLIAIVFKEAFKSSKSNDKHNLIMESEDYLIKNYTNRNREREITAYVDDIQNEAEIYKSLDDDLKFIFGDDYRDKYAIHPNGCVPAIGMIDRIEQKIAINLLMSHEGLITDWNVRKGYYIINNPNNVLVGIYLMRTVQRIEHNLNKKHSDERLTLWYKPDLIENSDGKLKFVNSWTRGRFYWKWTWFCDNDELVRAWSDTGNPVFIKYLFSLIPEKSPIDWWF